ncbi:MULTISPECIES: inositol-3-phosphate synthase [Candidatus Nitrosocaldus]|jgi:myo-inositol-1-phosphate synthase|uniref:Inositol-3-phosphate synthase n=1 Tax=Candidatus Nitrosocaldus cavascurensis TaxID=2058097 RepID=A0A2K5ASC8_9ARCH|nr:MULTISPECIES: inositol-3-phosphate synthase [Candidatus Nitrosocaldus]SPC34558.1 Inositol-3-phosphate synthase [Candidatus Nitrosocaldus cavascurensis]
MRKKVRVAIAGVGNCASALIQGTRYYAQAHEDDATGLIAYSLGGIEPGDIEFVAAFDVAENKVGKDLAEGIFEEPNNTLKVCDVERLGVKIEKGEVHDGIGRHLSNIVKVSSEAPVDVAKRLEEVKADVLINYLPVGSVKGTMYYAEQALKAHTCFINAMPVFIASDERWQSRFVEQCLPVAGDDVMSQLGATVLHKTLIKLLVDRGVKVEHTYQLNIGGDADFYNMLDEERLEQKRESKASAVRAMLPYEVPMRIGPSDYVPFLANEKVCYIHIKGRYFCNVPLEINVKLNVIDAFNSAGVMIDAVRAARIALDRGISGPLVSVSAYCFKHPPVQMPYNEAKQAFMEFVQGKRDR